jgi:hypothetical protein
MVFEPLMLALPSLYLGMRMSKVVFGRHCNLLPSFFFHWPSFRLFWLDHPRRSLLSYADLLALGQLDLRWPKQDLLLIELDHVHVHWEWVFVELHLGTLCEFQSSFIYGLLNLSTENIAIVSSMQVRIMPFTVSILFELFWLWYDMNTWQFNLFLLQQVIKDPITLSDVESVVNLILLTFRSRFQARAYEWTPPTPFGYAEVGLFVSQ